MVSARGLSPPETLPLQPANAHPESGAAVSSTTVSGGYAVRSGFRTTRPPPSTLTFSTKGPAAPTVRFCAPESPPPGPGVNTVTLRLPGEVTSEAGIAAVTWFVLTKPVARSAPSRRTTVQGVKPEPLTVSVNAGSPARFELGSIPAA